MPLGAEGDPACGSGNFLYLALRALKDLEHKAQVEAEALGLPRGFPRIGPEVVKGIELNPYAAELARVSVWIGEIQWMLFNGFAASQNPILKPLETIECRDALMTWQPGESEGEGGQWIEAEWPKADVIVGNPPFLGGKLLRSELGAEIVDRLFSIYRNRVPAEADLVVYWVRKAFEAVGNETTWRVGLVTTNSLRGGANRRVMDSVAEKAAIFTAWADEPWTVEGAAVRVSMVVFGSPSEGTVRTLNGKMVARINADLTATAFDLTKAARMTENSGVAFMGDTKGGSFDIPGALAREWLRSPVNPNGLSNAAVLKPWINGSDVVRRPRDMWIIDFGWEMSEADASAFEMPFQHVAEQVRPERMSNNRDYYRRYWWRHVEPRQGMWEALKGSSQFIVTPRVSKHRLFVRKTLPTIADSATIVVVKSDDTTFGILHCRFHELWALRMGTWLGKGNDPRYTPTSTFETFPFPDGLTPDIPADHYADDPRAIAIAEAAKRLDELRENWLNPADLVRREPEVIAGYPDRIIPVSGEAEKVLKKRTLTNLYNERPAWLQHAHKTLDDAVAAAYGWPTDLDDDEVLARLFALNQERAAKE